MRSFFYWSFIMTTIIALKGRQHSGKTPTLKLLEQVVCSKYTGSVKILHEERDIGGSRDIFVVLEINGLLTVGIYSLGDYADAITTNLQTAISMKCDIIFCACRIHGKTTDAVKSFESNAVKVTLTRKIYEPDKSKQDLTNKSQVRDMMNLAQL